MRYHKLFWHLRLVWTFCLLSSRSLSIARFHTAADEDYQTTLITQHSLVRDCIINTFELICSCNDKSKALLSVCCFLSISRLSSLAFFLRFSLFFLVPDSQYLIFHGEWGKVNPFFVRKFLVCLSPWLPTLSEKSLKENLYLWITLVIYFTFEQREVYSHDERLRKSTFHSTFHSHRAQISSSSNW